MSSGCGGSRVRDDLLARFRERSRYVQAHDTAACDQDCHVLPLQAEDAGGVLSKHVRLHFLVEWQHVEMLNTLDLRARWMALCAPGARGRL